MKTHAPQPSTQGNGSGDQPSPATQTDATTGRGSPSFAPGDLCYLPGWLFGMGVYVVEVLLTERRGAWWRVEMRALWWVREDVLQYQRCESRMTVRQVYLHERPNELLAMIVEVQHTLERDLATLKSTGQQQLARAQAERN